MPLTFVQTSEADRDEICALFRDAFVSKNESLAFMRWKFWQPRPDWEGSRGYKLCQGEKLIAHAGILPAVFHSGPVKWRALHFIDWVSSRHSVSGGVQLLRRLAGLTDLVCAVGGTAATQSILPMIGFKPLGAVLTMARPVRPYKQAITHQWRDWKLPLRFARNTAWNLSAPLTAPSGWTAEPVRPQDIGMDLWAPRQSEGTLVRERSPDVTSYFLSCPDVPFRFFLARERNAPQGCFLIADVGGQARIADLWINNATAERYQAMYRLACLAAYQNRDVAEIAVYSSMECRTQALLQCGFRVLRTTPFMMLSGTGAGFQAIDCQMIDNDAPFLHRSGFSYST